MDLEIIRVEDVKMIMKRRQKLQESLKKGYATVYRQCSQQAKRQTEVNRKLGGDAKGTVTPQPYIGGGKNKCGL